MITIRTRRTRPINTHPVSSMRAALNSGYCMRAQILARSLGNGQANGETKEELFSYQEGQHRVVFHGQKLESKNKPHLPEEVRITKTKNGKRWRTSSMEAELVGDILEIRDGLSKVVDAHIFKHHSR